MSLFIFHCKLIFFAGLIIENCVASSVNGLFVSIVILFVYLFGWLLYVKIYTKPLALPIAMEFVCSYGSLFLSPSSSFEKKNVIF